MDSISDINFMYEFLIAEDGEGQTQPVEDDSDCYKGLFGDDFSEDALF